MEMLRRKECKVKVVILAGGFGTRISEESHLKPKPMITIGEQPILWHIMKYYSSFGFYDFIICCGYKGHCIKEYFADYYLHRSNVTFDFSAENRMTIHSNVAEPWRVTLIDTGLYTQTGGRVKRVEKYIGNESFMLTYGDGVSNVNIADLVAFHKVQGKKVTLTAACVEQRFGVLDIAADKTITSFREKSRDDQARINAGYMVVEPDIFDYIKGDATVFEKEPLERMAAEGQLAAYAFDGYWQCMDTKREMDKLNELWDRGLAPWKTWED